MESMAANQEALMLRTATMTSSCSLLRLRIAMFICFATIAARESEAADFVINNGLAPPNPANLLDTSVVTAGDDYYVRNVDCPPLWPSGSANEVCPSPGAPTEVHFVGGFLRDLYVTDTSRLVAKGGSARTLIAQGDAEMIVEDSSDALGVSAEGNSTVLMHYGADPLIFASSTGTASLTYNGNWEIDNLWAGGSSHFLQLSGYAEFTTACGDDAHFVQAGGLGEEMVVFDQCEMEINGDGGWNLEVTESGRVTIRSGGIRNTIMSRNSAQVRIFGTQFALDGSPVYIPDGGEVSIPAGQLTGVLASGQSFDTTIVLSEQGEVLVSNVYPVPVSAPIARMLMLALMAVTGAPIALRLRSGQQRD